VIAPTAPNTTPHVQYAHTSDGVGIAFHTLGQGFPLLYLAGGPWSHVDLWQIPESRQWYERLAQHRMLIRHDVRGTGLSERAVADFSLDAHVRDVEAVVDRLRLPRVAVLGAADAGAVAITYAARHPERVSRLLLWCAWARTADIDSPRIQAWRGLLEQDWGLMTETCAHLALGWSAGEIGRQSVAWLQDAVTPETARAALEAIAAFDATPLLPQVQAPTLVLHRQDISWFPLAIARDLAARLPDARLLTFPGESTAPYLGDAEAAADAIDAFLGRGEEAPALRLGSLPATASTPRLEAVRQPFPHRLTAREVDVLRLVANGQTNDEIAAALWLSVRTVERHIGNLYGKIGARGRADATAYALTRGFVQVSV
jgi:pimeloyl-ACP methyl ester carboxylesterase/DNA-binding CsgD family transcriptional regulator